MIPGASVLSGVPGAPTQDLERLRARLTLPDRFLLYPAQTWPHKNHEGLLEALALIKTREGLAVPLVCPGKHTPPFQADRAAPRATSASPRRPRSRDSSAPSSSAGCTSWRPRWSSRAASRAGACPSARPFPPACRSPPRAQRACLTSSTTPACSSTPTTPSRSPSGCSSSGATPGCGRRSPSAAGSASKLVQLRSHRTPVPRALPPDRWAGACGGRPYPSGGPTSRLSAGPFRRGQPPIRTSARP